MQGGSVGGVQDQSPVAELIAESLHHDLAISGQGPRRILLLANIVGEVGGGEVIQPVLTRPSDGVRG